MKDVCFVLIAISLIFSAKALPAQARMQATSTYPLRSAYPTARRIRRVHRHPARTVQGRVRIQPYSNLGQGQTIAIVDPYDDPNIEADLAAYQAQFHLTPCNFHKVKVGNPAASPGWGIEIALDVEQVCALAPQANIILVEANSIASPICWLPSRSPIRRPKTRRWSP